MRSALPDIHEVPTRRFGSDEAVEADAPDTRCDPSCHSGVQRVHSAPQSLETEPWAEAAESLGEPDGITLVSVYDPSGLQTPEPAPLVEVVAAGTDSARPAFESGLELSGAEVFDAPELDQALQLLRVS